MRWSYRGLISPGAPQPDDPTTFVGLSRIFLAFIGKFSFEDRSSQFDVVSLHGIITYLGLFTRTSLFALRTMGGINYTTRLVLVRNALSFYVPSYHHHFLRSFLRSLTAVYFT
jgi:hypothetical protein